MLKVTTTDLRGVLRITPPTLHEDYRGEFVETYNERLYRDAGIDVSFVQDDISVSHRHVLRGVHGDASTWKLVSCLAGRVYLLVVNNDPSSDQYKRWQGFTLSDRNRTQMLIPPCFGNGHLVLSDTAIYAYKQSTYYDRDSQFTIAWNDPAFGFRWPVKTPVLSARDDLL